MIDPASTGRRPKEYSRARLLAAFAAVYVVWGSTYLFIRFAVETLPPFVMAGARFAVAGAILYLWARLRGTSAPTRAEAQSAAIAGVFLLVGGNGAVVWAEQRVPSSVTALLVATVPVWMVLLDWLRPGGVRPRVGVFAGLALGLLGLAMLVGRGAMGGEGADPVGAGVLVVGSILWATGSLYVGRNPRPPSALIGNGVQMLAGGAVLLAVGTMTGELGHLDLAAASTRSLLSLLYLIVAGSLIGFTAYTYLLRVSTPAKVSTYAYVNPVVAVFLGWAFAGEEVTARTVIAAAVILAGVAIITSAGSAPGEAAAGDSDRDGGQARDAVDETPARKRRRIVAG
ncbi:MAG: EamA family transporter [Gemmatimonadota bacterium]|nr:EamA family transporter [Gemmatimonadota bacterium]